MNRTTPEATEQLIATLYRVPHQEGGYYCRTFQSDDQSMLITAAGPRFRVTSIYYLLTRIRPQDISTSINQTSCITTR